MSRDEKLHKLFNAIREFNRFKNPKAKARAEKYSRMLGLTLEFEKV